jgi:hypothetical protein
MNSKVLVVATIAAGLVAAQPALARGVPAGAGGPPPGVHLGPPPHAGADVKGPKDPDASGKSLDNSADANEKTLGQAANILGKLNAAHASATALAHANANSAVGALAAYQTNMSSATTDAEITAARQQLASASNKTLTAAAITRIDGLLGIKGASPTLGTTQ